MLTANQLLRQREQLHMPVVCFLQAGARVRHTNRQRVTPVQWQKMKGVKQMAPLLSHNADTGLKRIHF